MLQVLEARIEIKLFRFLPFGLLRSVYLLEIFGNIHVCSPISMRTQYAHYIHAKKAETLEYSAKEFELAGPKHGDERLHRSFDRTRERIQYKNAKLQQGLMFKNNKCYLW